MRKTKTLSLGATMALFIMSSALTVSRVAAQDNPVELWALIVCGSSGMSFSHNTGYMYHVISVHYTFDGIRYLSPYSSDPGVDDSATRTNVMSAITSWLSQSDPNDIVFIYFSSHGGGYNAMHNQLQGGRYEVGGDEGNEVRESTLGQDVNGDGDTSDWVGVDECMQVQDGWYWDDELASDLDTLSYARLIFVRQGCVEEGKSCFGGGLIDDISAHNRIIMTATNETWYSYGDRDGDGYSEWSEAFIDALHGEDTSWDDATRQVVHAGIEVDADINNDGQVSIWEAWNYAWWNDDARLSGDETPWLDDNGNGLPTYREEDDFLDPYDDSLSVETYLEPPFEKPIRTDINWDGIVNIYDMALVVKAWQIGSGHPRYNPYVDFDGNRFIDIDDVARVALDWEKTFSDTGGNGGTGTPEFSLCPNEIEVYKYQTFSVDVTVTDVTDLYCYQFYLYYNATVLNCTDVSLPPNHFLKPVNPDYILIVKQEYDNAYNATHGRVLVAVTLMADEPGKNGNGTLATISFKATGLGSSTLHLYAVEIGDSLAEAVPVIVVDGSVNVLPPPSLTVLAEDQHGNSLMTGDVYIDGQWRGLTGSTFTVSAGTHTVRVSDFWDNINIGYRYGFQHWEDGSTDNPRTITVVEDTTIKAYFYKKYCPGDCDGDGIVYLLDLSILTANWHKSIPPGDPRADLNGDDLVDLLDLAILAANWYKEYPDP